MNAAALSEWRVERREALCRVTSWKSSETQTLGETKRARERERKKEGREGPPPGGQRRRKPN